MLHPCSTGRTKWLSSIIYTCNVVVGIRSRCLNIGQNLNANVDPFTAVVRHLLNQHHHHYFHLTQSTHDLLDDGLPSRSKGCTRTRQLKRTWTSVVWPSTDATTWFFSDRLQYTAYILRKRIMMIISRNKLDSKKKGWRARSCRLMNFRGCSWTSKITRDGFRKLCMFRWPKDSFSRSGT